ncbi:MAG: hypothetical protein PHD01_11670 [Geobacteraceae bacterium]|nr:hypothetical protein [Geobacteraceae bacterium]
MPKKSRTELLPPYNDIFRTIFLNMLLVLPDYKEKQKEGYPLRTKEELEIISDKYSKEREGSKTGGITFEEINEEQGKKSPLIKLKKTTFRKYIQDSLLPKSIGYTNVENKRMALFPNDIITHINFLYYFYKIADTEALKVLESIRNIDPEKLLASFGYDGHLDVTFLDAIKAHSEQTTLDLAVAYYCCVGDPGIIGVVHEVFANRPEEMKEIIERIDKIEEAFREGMAELTSYLNSNTLKFSDLKKE